MQPGVTHAQRESGAEAVVAAAAAAALYVSTLAPTVQAGDSGELILAAQSLGIPHPPGYPVWVLLGHLASIAPWGTLAARVNALSALLAALSAGLFFVLATRLGLARGPRWVATALLAGSTIVWRSAVQAEVYALALAAFLTLAWLALQARGAPRASRRAEAAFFFVAGAAPLVHQTLLFPSLVLGAWVLAPRPGASRLLPKLLWVGLGFSLVLFLPIRSALHPAFAWRPGLGLTDLFGYLLRSDYGALRQNPLSFHRAMAEAGSMAALVLAGFGVLGAVLATVGALSGGARHRELRVVGLAALSIPVALMVLISFTPDPEHLAQIEPFLAPVLVPLALLAGVGLETTLARTPRGARAPVLAGIACAAAITVGLHFGSCDRRQFTLPERYGRDLLSGLPHGATLVLDGDNETFLVAYLTRARELRPDLTLIHRRGYIFGDPYGLRGVPRSCWIEVAHRVDLERLATSRSPIYYATPPEDLVRGGVRFVNQGLVYRAVPPGSREPGPRTPSHGAGWPRSSDLLPQGPKRYDYVTRKLAVTYSDVRAQELWGEGRFAEALPWFEDAARVGFDFPATHLNLATAAAAGGRPELALEALLRARALSPADPEPSARLGVLMASARLYREAATWFERAYRIRPAPALAADAARAWSLAGDGARARMWRHRAQFTGAEPLRHTRAHLDPSADASG